MSSLVAQFAVGSGDKATAVRELRWQLEHARGFSKLGEMPEDLVEKVKGAKDDDLFQVAQLRGWKIRNVEVAIPLTVVDAVLSSPVAGLSPESLLQLTRLKWQAYLLAHQARGMEEYMRLSFTVTDPNLHTTVLQNHEGAKEWYAKRASFMLEAIRQALAILDP